MNKLSHGMETTNSKTTEEGGIVNPYSDPSASKSPLIVYFILSYLITWTCWLVAMQFLLNNGYAIPNHTNFVERYETGYADASHRFYSYLFQLGTLGPMIAAFIVTGIYYKGEGVKNLLRRMVFFKVPIKWYGIIILLPLAFALVGLLFALMQGAALEDSFVFPTPWYLLLVMLFSQIFSSGLEEPGWRGFATPEMQKFKNAEDTGYLIGIFWAIWHFPFLIYLYTAEMQMPTFLVVLSLIGYVALTVPMAIILVWVYNNTKSVALLILSHAFNNIIPAIVMGGIVDSTGGFTIAIITWITAGILSKKFGKVTLTGISEEQ